MRIRKTASGITAAIMLATVVCSPLCDNLPLTSGGVAVVAGAEKVNSASARKSVTDYSYTVTPLLEPFNEYFFVKTDNPDPARSDLLINRQSTAITEISVRTVILGMTACICMKI